jgi:hypothetical protein
MGSGKMGSVLDLRLLREKGIWPEYVDEKDATPFTSRRVSAMIIISSVNTPSLP